MIIACNYFTAGSGDGRRKRRNSGRGSDFPHDKSAVSVLLQIQSLISFWINFFNSGFYVCLEDLSSVCDNVFNRKYTVRLTKY